MSAVYAVTDAQQQLVWAGEHDAFGAMTLSVGTLEQQPLRFPGQYYDAETGLYYNWHRYYNPATGRYISSDPIGLAGGLNAFGYVGQSPLGTVDPSGLFWEDLAPNAYEEVGRFTDWLINHANEDIAAQGGLAAFAWDNLAASALDTAHALDNDCYRAAAVAAAMTVIKPLKLGKKLSKSAELLQTGG